MHKIWICLQACLLWTQSACGNHIHSSDKTWKKGTLYDFLYKTPYFFVTTWPNQMGSSLNCRIFCYSFIIRFDLSDSIKSSFAIDTQMPIVFFFFGGGGTIGICVFVFILFVCCLLVCPRIKFRWKLCKLISTTAWKKQFKLLCRVKCI